MLDQIELHPDVEVTDQLRRLQETATDIVIANESHFERNAGFERVAERGAVAAIGDRNDDIGFNWEFPGEFFAHLDANLIDIAIGDGAVWPSKINVLEDTKGAALL